MMQLYDYCNAADCLHYFLDGFLKIIGEEMVQCGFEPQKAPSRETFVNKMLNRFGSCAAEPVCVDVPLVNNPMSTTKELNNPYKVQHPERIIRGQRDVVQVIKFQFVHQLLDLMDD